MQREIRRKDRVLDEQEARAILERGEYGVLATVDAEGQPYGTPISYCVMDGTLYIHSASTGQKVDNLAAAPLACFTVVGPTEPVHSGNDFSTYYESCMVFGTTRLVTDDVEKRASLMALAQKYFPQHTAKAGEYITRDWKRIAVYAIDITRITGKAKKKPA